MTDPHSSEVLGGAGSSAASGILGSSEAADPAEALKSLPAEIPYEPPVIGWDPAAEAPAFYDWRATFPFLSTLLRYAPVIWQEVKSTKLSRWFDWPEAHLYDKERGHTWKVMPFCHTFPANDPSKTTWLPDSLAAFPFTATLLQRIPGLRTALFSRMGPSTTLTPHQGWAALSNHVLRVHLPLYIPDEGSNPCGLVVEGEVQHHRSGGFIVFDDSKTHFAFNKHKSENRFVLIFDLVRPPGLPLGTATGDMTAELTGLIDYFK